MASGTGTVSVREVGPRDGLQVEAPLPVAIRARLVERLVDAGVRAIEAVSFVAPRRVPAMAGAAEVMSAIARHPQATYTALVPNVRGAELALEAGVDAMSVTLSASETYSQKNVGRSRADAEVETERIIELVNRRLEVDVVVSCVFGSPYGEAFDVPRLVDLVARLRSFGATVTLADTTGQATPRRVEAAVDAVGAEHGLHFHDTRHTALLNAYVALGAGVRRLDSSVGGLGGSPFADSAGGNLATEDLVALADDLGLETGIDLGELLEVSRWLTGVLGHRVPSALPLFGTP